MPVCPFPRPFPQLDQPVRSAILLIGALASLAAGEDPGETDTGPRGPVNDWSVAVPGWKAPEPGEHPRLFFRRSQLDEMRKRAQTPEGKAIVERLRVMLNGSDGASLPAKFNPTRVDKEGGGSFGSQTVTGEAFTLWHVAGYGMLWQLTGDRKFAELGKEATKRILDGQRDRDDRYSFIGPHGALRAGPSIGAMAMGYDLCYDGWDDEFRRRITLELQNYDQGGPETIESMANGRRHGPHSNHWGCQIGGASMALLAIRNDPGTDPAKVEPLVAAVRANVIRQLVEGFGETGYFNEHPGPGQIASDTAFVPGLQAWYVAGGRDFHSPRTHARYLMLRFTSWIVPEKGKPWYLNPSPQGSYGNWVFERHGLSRGGQFAQGFFGLSEAEKAATLWVYKTFVEPSEQADYGKPYSLNGKPSWDALPYPHRAVLALVNWPIGIEAKNPEGILPQAIGDRQMGYHFFRNRWKDDRDILCGVLLGSRGDKATSPEIWGLGQRRISFGKFKPGKGGKADHFTAAADGSGVVTAQGTSMAIDFSKASGADAVFVMVGPGATGGKDTAKSKVSTVKAGAITYSVMVMSDSGGPEPKADGDKLVVGGQTFTFDGRNLAMAKMAGPYQGPVQINK